LRAQLVGQGPDHQITVLIDTPLQVGDRCWVMQPGQSLQQARGYIVKHFRPGIREGDAAHAILVAYLGLDMPPVGQIVALRDREIQTRLTQKEHA
jgi:hypothetical protein